MSEICRWRHMRNCENGPNAFLNGYCVTCLLGQILDHMVYVTKRYRE
jgi:hypothetical protein